MAGRASALVGDLSRHLRSRILAGEYGPDDRVTATSVATEYGVARPTARSALDLLAADGLLVGSAFASLRVRVVGTSELAEVLSLLEHFESRSLDRLLVATADLREVREASRASLHQLLDAVVRASGSERLATFHRQCTFELLLGLAQAGVREPEAVEDPRGRMVSLADALFRQDDGAARGHLQELWQARRTLVGAATPAAHA